MVTDTGTVEVRAAIPAEVAEEVTGGLHIGGILEGALRQETDPVCMVPWRELAAARAGPAVWVIDPDNMAASPTPVVIARHGDDGLDISKGLRDGMSIVGAWSQSLCEGMIVKPVTDTSLGSRRLRLTVDAPSEDFRVGSLVAARYEPAHAPVMIVPGVAVLGGIGGGGGGPQVWRVEGTDRRVTRVPVTLGAEIGDRVVITEGIAVGDEIVTRGVQSLTEGQIVGEALQ